MIDQVSIEISGGDGGNGAVSFHREKFVQEGGPDGGRGGRGGHVVLITNPQINTLRRYRRSPVFRAAAGRPGGTNKRRGRDGEDLFLEVPPGTIVSRLDPPGAAAEQIADLAEEGAGALVARGGLGGHGNTYFRSSTNRAPRVAQRGQAGRQILVRLELRLIADVGLVGLPNAGKSTLLGQLSRAKPRVGAYPFTTLEPYLGVVHIGWDEFVLADLPGLIAGAAAGAGLGHDFLRHASRTKLLVHLLDGAEPDPLQAFDVVNQELRAYQEALGDRPQIVAINKIDQPGALAGLTELEEQLRRRGLDVTAVSAATGEGTEQLAQLVWRRLQELREAQTAAAEAATQGPRSVEIRPRPDRRRYRIEREGASFRVRGDQVETFVEMMDTGSAAALEEVHRWFERRGVSGALRKAGVTPGAKVRVGATEWGWEA
jgi:GTP-binding protein